MKKFLFGLCFLASAQSMAGVMVTDCKIREPAPTTNRTALYFNVFFNESDEIKALRLPGDEALLRVETTPELTENTEIHQTVMRDGVMSMQAVSKVNLKANDTVEFKRGGLHVMLLDLKKRPLEGETYPVQFWLTFLGEVQCDAVVVKADQL